jgi:hypothetical protein
MDKQLSKEQIDEIFKFVKSKYVRYIDLQYELVDHLASAVEVEMEKDQELNFSAALSKVYGRFPVTGFTHFVAEKQVALTSYWRQRWFQVFKSYFTPPRVFLTFLLFVFCFSFTSAFGTNGAGTLLVISLMLKIFAMIKIHLKVRRNNIKVSDFLFFNTGLAFFMVNFWFEYLGFQVLSNVEFLNGVWLLGLNKTFIISLITTLAFLFTHATFIIFPKMLTDEIRSKYLHLGLNLN